MIAAVKAADPTITRMDSSVDRLIGGVGSLRDTIANTHLGCQLCIQEAAWACILRFMMIRVEWDVEMARLAKSAAAAQGLTLGAFVTQATQAACNSPVPMVLIDTPEAARAAVRSPKPAKVPVNGKAPSPAPAVVEAGERCTRPLCRHLTRHHTRGDQRACNQAGCICSSYREAV